MHFSPSYRTKRKSAGGSLPRRATLCCLAGLLWVWLPSICSAQGAPLAASLAASMLGLSRDPIQQDRLDTPPPDSKDDLMDGGLQKKVLEYRGNQRRSLLSFGHGSAANSLGIK